MKPLRVLLVDDQRLFAASLKQVLESNTDAVEAVTVASDGEEALGAVRRFGPDVILMDTHMPKADGIEATRRIRAEFPEVKILMLSAFGYEDYVRDAMGAGANGYLLKDISPEELIMSVKNAVAGVVILSPQVVSSINRIHSKTKSDKDRSLWFHELTAKERLVLLLISKGYSNGEIAERLNLGPQTVRNYVSEIYSKMGARDRFEAIRMAIEVGISTLVENRRLW